MSWFKREVEKIVERTVYGDAIRVPVYESIRNTTTVTQLCVFTHEVSCGVYRTSDEAFAAHPGCQVRKLDCFMINGEYYRANALLPVVVAGESRGAV